MSKRLIPKMLLPTGEETALPDGARLVFVSSGDKDIKLAKDLYERAAKQGQTLSQLLEELSPTDRDASGRLIGLDAFERQLRRFNIIPETIAREGIFASEGRAFFQSGESAVLFPEFINRVARIAKIAPADIDLLIGSTRQITGSTFESLNIDFTPEGVSKKRTAEATEFPIAKLSWSDVPGKVKKYGREVQATYEFIRRCSLDLFGTAIELIMLQARVNEMDDAVATLVANLSGTYTYNANGAGGLDPASAASATPKNFTYKAFLAFAGKFNPYKLNVLIGNLDALVRFVSLTKPNPGPFDIIAALKQGPATVNISLGQDLWGPVTLVLNENVTADTYIGIQKEYAIERIVEVGADLTETEKVISKQFDKIVISDCLAFSPIWTPTIRKITLN